MRFPRTFAALVLAASLAAVPAWGLSDVLIDENVEIKPLTVRPLEFDISVRGTRVLCTYHVEQGRSGVRAVLLKRGDMKLWLSGKANSILAATAYDESGGFSSMITEPGAYSVVLDNRLEGRDVALVRLQVKLVSGLSGGAPVQKADPRRADIVVWSSVALFGILSLLCGWRIYLALQRRQDARESVWNPSDPRV